MINLQFVQQDVPVPRLLQSEFIQRAEELVYDPLLHELLERVLAPATGRQIIHADSGENRKEMPIPPEPLVNEILDILRIVLHHCCEYRVTDLGVPGLVSLDTGHHLLKGVIAGFMRQRSEADELKIGEARFQHYVGGDVELDDVPS